MDRAICITFFDDIRQYLPRSDVHLFQ